MSKPHALPFQPLTKETAAQLLLNGGCSVDAVFPFVCRTGPLPDGVEVALGCMLAKQCGSWDSADEFVRRMRR